MVANAIISKRVLLVKGASLVAEDSKLATLFPVVADSAVLGCLEISFVSQNKWHRDIISKIFVSKFETVSIADIWFQQDGATCHTVRD